MSRRPASRIRPNLEALEVREVCFAGVSLGIAIPDIPLHKAPPIFPVGVTRIAPPTPPTGRHVAEKPTGHLNQADSVITLKNETTTTIRFSVRWAGTSETTWYNLAPGQSQRVTFRQVELFRQNLMAVIQYSQVSDGGVVRTARVASGLEPIGSDGTSQGDGRVYTFQPTGAGVGLNPAMRVKY